MTPCIASLLALVLVGFAAQAAEPAARFRFLTPADDAGILIHADADAAFASLGPDVDGCVTERLPARHLARRWRIIGAKLYQHIPYDSESTAEFCRRKAGFLAFSKGADGVYYRPTELPPAWIEAVEFAKRDVASCERLLTLAAKGEATCRMALVTEARRARHWLASVMEPEWSDLDRLRLENLALIRRLELLLGETPSEPNLPTAPKEPDAPKATFNPDDFEPYTMVFDNTGFKACDDVSLLCNHGCFAVQLSGDAKRPLGKDEFPGGVYIMNLWVPGVKRGDWLPYRFSVNMDPRPRAGDHAPYPGSNLFLYEFRFGDDTAGRERLKREAVRTWGPGYAKAGGNYVLHYHNTPDGKWQFLALSIAMADFWEYLPGVTPGKTDFWYLEVIRPDGRATRHEICWPTGSRQNRDSYFAGMAFSQIEEDFSRAVADVELIWKASEAEKGCRFRKTVPASFSIFDLESDDLFYRACVQPLLDRTRNVRKHIHVPPIRNAKPPVLSEGAIIRDLVGKRIPDLFNYQYSVDQARKAYLLDRFAGHLPDIKAPRADAGVHRETPGGPDVDAGGPLDELQLDEDGI